SMAAPPWSAPRDPRTRAENSASACDKRGSGSPFEPHPEAARDRSPGGSDMSLHNPWGVSQVTRDRAGQCDCHKDPAIAQERDDEETSSLSRRRLLRMGIAGAAGVMAGGAVEFAVPGPSFAQSKLSPDAALQKLMDGNKRFVERQLTFYKED